MTVVLAVLLVVLKLIIKCMLMILLFFSASTAGLQSLLNVCSQFGIAMMLHRMLKRVTLCL